jgi:hypothetical protein
MEAGSAYHRGDIATGAQMPIGAWDHRFHGEGERQ